jgi:hypothetical protein
VGSTAAGAATGPAAAAAFLEGLPKASASSGKSRRMSGGFPHHNAATARRESA